MTIQGALHRVGFISFIFLLTATTFAEFRALDVHSPNLMLGIPEGDYTQQEFVFRTLYTACIDRSKNQSRFVAYRIRLRHIAGDNDLERHWRPDDLLDADEQLEHEDYKGLKIDGETVDRGHLRPLASSDGSPDAYQTNRFGNLLPQTASLNRGAWLKIENREREFVRQYDNVWVICGGLYEEEIGQIKDEDGNQPIPSACWKVIAIKSGGVKLAAFIMPQKIERKADPAQFQVTVAEVEKRTKLNLFPLLKEPSLKTKKSTWWKATD